MVVNILLLLLFIANKMTVYIILTKLKTTSPFSINNNKERNFCLQLNPFRIADFICLWCVFGLIKLKRTILCIIHYTSLALAVNANVYRSLYFSIFRWLDSKFYLHKINKTFILFIFSTQMQILHMFTDHSHLYLCLLFTCHFNRSLSHAHTLSLTRVKLIDVACRNFPSVYECVRACIVFHSKTESCSHTN